MRQVITVSREIGTDGDLVARRVADNLGFRYLDKKILAEQARSFGMSISQVEACDITEDDYRVRGLVDSLFSDRAVVTVVESLATGASVFQTSRTLDEKTCITLEGTIIKALAERGRMVIVGRGGQVLLRSRNDVLNVKIIAPYGHRVQNLMFDKNIGRAEAVRIVEDRDMATKQYLKRFYGIDWTDNSYYDIVLNKEKLSVLEAASYITELARLT
ncbi:MAG: cytidylate kinase-like family protein [Thaumarchaeota archaeon]|nr:cytidylate kinase-like family protein [Nitrososphaerota archaeon]